MGRITISIKHYFRHSIFEKERRSSSSVSIKSILKAPKLDRIQEEDEVSSTKNTPQTERKVSEASSEPEADQGIQMKTRKENSEPICEKEEIDECDGAVRFEFPEDSKDDEFAKAKVDKQEFRNAVDSKHNEFEKSGSNLPKLRIIRILGGMFLSLGILGILLAPLSIHYFAKEQRKSYLFYQLPPHVNSEEQYPIQETHIIQVRNNR